MINYQEVFLKEYREIRKKDKNPNILIHVCCGACSVYPLIFLSGLFDITLLYTNSNIYPKEEFDRRLEALKKHVALVNETFKVDIKIMVDSYEHDEFINDLLPFKDEKEGGTRCKICIFKRMKRLFKYAKIFRFPYVSTIMSVSRNKDVNYISKICERLEGENDGIKFIHFDFKKNNGQDFGVEIGKEEEIYRQDYCGCVFSKGDFGG